MPKPPYPVAFHQQMVELVTTERDKRQRPAPDLVNRQFVARDINELWVADMTYIPTWAGFIYLAVVLDVYSRKVAGWAFGERMTAERVVAALNMALRTRKPGSVIDHYRPILWSNPAACTARLSSSPYRPTTR
jgi:transposase InsO family protein